MFTVQWRPKMRIVIIGLMFGSALGLVAGTTVSHYVSVAPKPVSIQQSQVVDSSAPKWDI